MKAEEITRLRERVRIFEEERNKRVRYYEEERDLVKPAILPWAAYMELQAGHM